MEQHALGSIDKVDSPDPTRFERSREIAPIGFMSSSAR
jgi:hypothetical protein